MPDLVFHGKGLRHFGVELEIDNGGTDRYNAEKLLNIANADAENLYIKTDGSLDDGLELVTHPMTLTYRLNEMPWAEILRKAQSMGYLSHAAGTYGLHVHISRLAFGCTYEQQEAAIARLLYFVEKFWAELLRFSRRTQSHEPLGGTLRHEAHADRQVVPREKLLCRTLHRRQPHKLRHRGNQNVSRHTQTEHAQGDFADGEPPL